MAITAAIATTMAVLVATVDLMDLAASSRRNK
jgi:hypothetical protein